MTKTEAQELIAEINKFYIIHYGECDSKMFMPDLEKIINRFANKPPYTVKTDDGLKQIRVAPHRVKEGIIQIVIEEIKHSHLADDGVIGLTKDELSKHIDNCQSMLGYLQDE